jgi:hypothetical protein
MGEGRCGSGACDCRGTGEAVRGEPSLLNGPLTSVHTINASPTRREEAVSADWRVSVRERPKPAGKRLAPRALVTQLGPSPRMNSIEERLTAIESHLSRLERIESLLSSLSFPATQPQPIPPREWYSIEEAAGVLGKSAYTLREHARLGRINARKLPQRRGPCKLWSVSADELDRIKNHGLLPLDPSRNEGASGRVRLAV